MNPSESTNPLNDSWKAEEKKSFWIIYTVVAVFYAIMITVYSLVVHNYTVNYQADIVEPNVIQCPGYVPPVMTHTYTAVKQLISMVGENMGFLQA